MIDYIYILANGDGDPTQWSGCLALDTTLDIMSWYFRPLL